MLRFCWLVIRFTISLSIRVIRGRRVSLAFTLLTTNECHLICTNVTGKFLMGLIMLLRRVVGFTISVLVFLSILLLVIFA